MHSLFVLVKHEIGGRICIFLFFFFFFFFEITYNTSEMSNLVEIDQTIENIDART